MRRTLRALTLAASAACALAASAACVIAWPAQARSLKLIQDTGYLGLCAHPNSLPFASKTATPPGFEIELGQAIADRLHVRLTPDWVLTAGQIPRAACDLLLDVIADEQAQSDNGLKFSKPYYRNGVALVVPRGGKIDGFAALNGATKVGVAVGSVTGMLLSQRGVAISIFGFEEDMIAAVASGEIAAAAVTPIFAGWFLRTHPDLSLTLLPMDTAEPRFHWSIAVGMRRSDPPLRAAIDEAVATFLADGTIARIYGGYGITLSPPP
jgi:polar amino acid transport system substrate-binding protein